MVTSDHDWSNLALANEFIEFQSNVDTTHTILVEDTSLGTNHQLVLFSIANPVVVIAVLVATSWIDRFHRCMVSCNQVFVFTAEADPTEWTITIVKEHRSHDIFYIRWPNEAVLVIQTILRNFLDAWVVNGFHEGITIVEEVGTFSRQIFNHCEVASQGFIDETVEGFLVFCQQACPFFKANTSWTITTIVNVVARGLVRQEMNMDLVFIDIFKQVYDITMVGNRSWFTSFQCCLS